MSTKKTPQEYSSFIQNSPKLETTQMSINSGKGACTAKPFIHILFNPQNNPMR